MNEYNNHEELKSIEEANIILTYIFVCLDSIILIFSFFYLKSINKESKLLKNKFLLYIIINVTMRLISLSEYYNINSLYKEIIITSFFSFQFFLIISFIIQVIEDLLNNNKINEKIDIVKLCIRFFFIFISYDKFLLSFSKKNICLLENIIILLSIFRLYNYLRKRINEPIQNLTPKDYTKNDIYSFLHTLFALSFFSFNLYYILKIFLLFINTTLYMIYIKICLFIFNESSKYLVFLIFWGTIFKFNRNAYLLIDNIHKNTEDEERISIYEN